MEEGDCYEANGRYFIDLVMKKEDKGFVICHGEVEGQKDTPVEGLKFGHCWIEKGDTVLDFSNGNNISMSKEKYYRLGRIKEDKVKKYKGKEFAKKILETGNWGSWD